MNSKKARGLGGKLGWRTLRSTEQSKEVHFFYTLNYTHLPRKLKYLKSRLAKDDLTSGQQDISVNQTSHFARAYLSVGLSIAGSKES